MSGKQVNQQMTIIQIRIIDGQLITVLKKFGKVSQHFQQGKQEDEGIYYFCHSVFIPHIRLVTISSPSLVSPCSLGAKAEGGQVT